MMARLLAVFSFAAAACGVTRRVTFEGMEGELIGMSRLLNDTRRLSNAESRCFMSPQIELRGGNFTERRGNHTECCSHCKMDNRCHAFTYTKQDDGTCWLNDSPTDLKLGTARSGYESTEEMALNLKNWEMRSYNMETVKSRDIQSCVKACADAPRCRVVTVNATESMNYTCYFSYSLSRFSKSKAPYLSSTTIFFR